MKLKALITVAISAVLAVGWAGTAQSATRLDPETMRMALQTANPAEEAYIYYACALVDRGFLPRKMVDSTFQWARKKPYPKKVQYFKYALITQAAKIGITLPKNVPAAANTITGRVIIKVLFVEVPCPNMNVVIEGTDLSTKTDKNGEFTFTGVSFGIHTLHASGVALLRPRTGSATVSLPTPPPSGTPTVVEIEVE